MTKIRITHQSMQQRSELLKARRPARTLISRITGKAAMTTNNRNGQPWQGGVSVPVLPPHIPLFDSAAIVVARQSDSQTGEAVSYNRGIFSKQSWSIGHPVPGVIQVLKPDEVRQIRDHVRDQLASRAGGLDDIPLRAFLAVADVYLDHETSSRFGRAEFGAIGERVPGQLQGEVTYTDGVAGTVVGSDEGVSAQSHLRLFPPGYEAPMRVGDLRSLISSLQNALAEQNLDPLWQRMLTFAQQAIA